MEQHLIRTSAGNSPGKRLTTGKSFFLIMSEDSDLLVNDQWIVSMRGNKNNVDPQKPYGLLVEKERTISGKIEDTGIIFLTNRECPFHCLMCDCGETQQMNRLLLVQFQNKLPGHWIKYLVLNNLNYITVEASLTEGPFLWKTIRKLHLC